MKRKIAVKVKDLEFENNPESVEKARRETMKLLRDEGYIHAGILISINTKTAYAWKYTIPIKPKPIKA